MNKVFLGILTLVLVSACSNRQMYEQMQNGQRLNCEKLPTSDEYDECITRASVPYDVYRRNFEEVIDDR